VDTGESIQQPEQEVVGNAIIIRKTDTGDITLEAIDAPAVHLALKMEGEEEKPRRIPVDQILELAQAARAQDS
jgi:hypothetical protein